VVSPLDRFKKSCAQPSGRIVREIKPLAGDTREQTALVNRHSCNIQSNSGERLMLNRTQRIGTLAFILPWVISGLVQGILLIGLFLGIAREHENVPPFFVVQGWTLSIAWAIGAITILSCMISSRARNYCGMNRKGILIASVVYAVWGIVISHAIIHFQR
jgi:hypothetical protein